MEYQDLKSRIKKHLNDAAEDFFTVGYLLRQISEKALFTEDGYKNIWEFAKGEYNLSASSASRFMAINARFSIDGGEHMAEKYIGMGVSKLQEMLGLPDAELEKVTQETTVREIRAMKAVMKEPLSFFGLPKAVYPEGSLIDMAGCGGDYAKYTCFSCARPCSIRQEERYCRTAPLGNPFSCTLMSGEKRLDIEAGLFSDKCQHLHPELAPVREGDKEPEPCCLTCEHKTCFSRCDVAKKKDETERQKELDELRKQQQEAEAKRPEPSDADIKAFYDWERIKAADNVTAEALKNKLRNAYGAGDDFNYKGSTRGIRINYKREITWAQLAKRIKEIQEKELQQKEREDAPAEAEYLTEFYEKDIYPSTRILIKNRDKAAITKLFKQEYGSTYENGSRTDGSSYNCYPDKIVFRSEPGAEGIQITWGRFVTKLLELLEENPEIEQRALDYDAKQRTEQKPDIIDADFREVEDYSVQEPDEADELQDQEVEADPEQYDIRDVREILRKHEADLKSYREVGELPEMLMKKQRILVDALTLLAKRLERFTPLQCTMPKEEQEFLFCLCNGYNIDFCLVMAMIQVESMFDADAVSATNDYGLMQINQNNHDWLTKTLGVEDYLDPYQNMRAGCYVLRKLFERYQNVELVLMCYNMGENGASRLWKNGIYSTVYTEQVLDYQKQFQEQMEGN